MATRRENSTRRRAPFRQPRTRLLVVCGGERTEPDYLNGLVRARGNPAVVVTVIGKGCAPERLVNHALLRVERSPDDFDEVWCVVDVDEFVLERAERAAANAGVRLAVSNPCFELWLLLHHEDCRAAVDGAPEALRRLCRHLPGYSKTKLNFTDFAAGVDDAIERGRRLDDGAIVGPNPSSGIWALVDTIVREAKQ
jgi:hypothetical protein